MLWAASLHPSRWRCWCQCVFAKTDHENSQSRFVCVFVLGFRSEWLVESPSREDCYTLLGVRCVFASVSFWSERCSILIFEGAFVLVTGSSLTVVVVFSLFGGCKDGCFRSLSLKERHIGWWSFN